MVLPIESTGSVVRESVEIVSDLKRWNVRIHAVFSLLFVGILFNKRIERKFVPQRGEEEKIANNNDIFQ